MNHSGAKICFLGDSGVGKSSIITRCLRDVFDPEYENTIGVYFYNLNIKFQGKMHLLHVWDTAGQERFRVISRLYYRGAKAVIIVYDVTQKRTFDSLSNWVKEVKNLAPNDVVLAIAGNKCDLHHRRAVLYEDGKTFAEEMGAIFMETSACSSQNIMELFTTIVTQLPKKIQERQDETTPLVLPKKNLHKRKICCS